MSNFTEILKKIEETFQWAWNSVTINQGNLVDGSYENPWYQNYFVAITVISIIVFGLELAFPWRKNQKAIRRNFWLDAFYMYFNIFIFSVIISGLYKFIELILPEVFQNFAFLDMSAAPLWLALLVFFILNDFVQWFTHVVLHKFEFLWQFHKVHHSVKEMGFAAHLRYHWMENIVYKPLKTLVVMIIVGGEPQHAVFIHFISIAIGHLNHANVKITWGPFKYLINNSVMHLWHHVKALPEDRRNGVNFGISLSLWDYIFGTNYIPHDSGDIEIGFENDEKFPIDNFVKQLIYPIGKKD